MKKLGFGLMRLPLNDKNDPASIDISLAKKMTDEFLSHGFTYFDTAWMYCGGESENAVRPMLCDRYPRESFLLADKLHARYLTCHEDRDKIFNTQLSKTGAGYFDYYLLHDLGVEHYKIFNKYDCFEWLSEKKKSGIVKKIGFSFHDSAALLDEVLTAHPEVDFVQLQINYLDWNSDSIQSRLCYETARRHGKDIIVMEPVKGGTLADVPQAVADMFKAHSPSLSVPSWAIRFAAGLDGVIMVLSGMSNLCQLRDNMSYMENFIPLGSDETKLVHRAADIINGNIAIACTGCEYCLDGCPKNIPIPKYFSLYNADMQETESKAWTPQSAYYENLCSQFGKPEDCISCGQCESVCPQHIHIIDELKNVSARFGE